MVADLKNGRWMKLCAMVFEFHHTPKPMIGAIGQATSTAACRAVRDTKTESLRENRHTPFRGFSNKTDAMSVQRPL
jgi:hypothetical protein